MEGRERIAKVMAESGLCSRREAEKLIAAGLVSLNGAPVLTPALTVTPADDIRVRGERLARKEAARLWLYHKPEGLVTSRAGQGRPTVFELLPKHLPRLISIGRLDLNTEGLLLLTNDGGLARHLELPSTGWKRRYRVRVYGLVSPQALEPLRRGVTIAGTRYAPAEVEPEPGGRGKNLWVSVTLTEGKNREIRKLFAHIGCTVSRLIRVSYGPFQLGNLKAGEVREVPQKVLNEQLGEAFGGASAGIIR